MSPPPDVPLHVVGDIGFEADQSSVHAAGDISLPGTLGYGGVVAAMDEWQAHRHEADLPAYQYRPGPQMGGNWGYPRATIRKVEVRDSDLRPDALRTHVWNNLEGSSPVTFHTTLQESVTVTDEVSTTKTLEVSDSLEVKFEVKGGPVSAGADNTLTVSASQSKSWSRSRTFTVGDEDGSEATLDPGKADLLVLSSLTGTLDVVATVQTYWWGTLQWRRNSTEAWKSLNLDVLTDHGLAAPLDHRGIHDGITEMTLGVGSVGEVDQTAIGVDGVDDKTLHDATNRVLAERFGTDDATPPEWIVSYLLNPGGDGQTTENAPDAEKACRQAAAGMGRWSADALEAAHWVVPDRTKAGVLVVSSLDIVGQFTAMKA